MIWMEDDVLYDIVALRPELLSHPLPKDTVLVCGIYKIAWTLLPTIEEDFRNKLWHRENGPAAYGPSPSDRQWWYKDESLTEEDWKDAVEHRQKLL